MGATATKKRTVEIWNLDLQRERVVPEPMACAGCGMVLDHPREFHPYAACLMFKGAGNNGGVVRDNLNAVILWAQEPTPPGRSP